MNDIEKMTRKSQEAMQIAAQLAEAEGHSAVEPMHLLYALFTQQDGVVPRVYEKSGISVQKIVENIKLDLNQ